VIVTFPPERVMSALGPISGTAPPLQPTTEAPSASEERSTRARKALLGTLG